MAKLFRRRPEIELDRRLKVSPTTLASGPSGPAEGVMFLARLCSRHQVVRVSGIGAHALEMSSAKGLGSPHNPGEKTCATDALFGLVSDGSISDSGLFRVPAI